ncbi:hypothetical protein HAX54_006778 [Datura stramonium]|uniref:Uncharacterized protein n=1 Tax=Datura stramonium TaxID=4076 RepID=A0ABS8WYE8_DATST|nr:hypothetical protein [Datura stramonium]
MSSFSLIAVTSSPQLLSSLKYGEARIFNSLKFYGITRKKDKEVETSSKGFKRPKKGVSPSSLVLMEPPTRKFGAKAVEEHGIEWFNSQKEAMYA